MFLKKKIKKESIPSDPSEGPDPQTVYICHKICETLKDTPPPSPPPPRGLPLYFQLQCISKII